MNNTTGAGSASPAVADYRLPRSQGIAYVSAYVVEFFFIIIGNIVVLAVFGKNQHLRQRKSHWLLINQSVTDLLAGIMIGPFWVYHLASRFDLWDCCGYPYLNVASDSVCLLFPSISSLNLLAIALERMYATLWPIKHRALSARNYRVAIGLVWSLSLGLPCIREAQLLHWISVSTYYYTMMTSSSCVLLLIILSYASIWIKFKFFRHPQNNLRATQERKLTASLFLVTAASLITHLSGTVLFSTAGVLYAEKSVSFISESHARANGMLLISANLMLNPAVYSWRMPGFRRAALRLVSRGPRTENRALAPETVQLNRANFQARPATSQKSIMSGRTRPETRHQGHSTTKNLCYCALKILHTKRTDKDDSSLAASAKFSPLKFEVV